MIERADQLVLEFVSKVADTAHGRMRPEQRLDFVSRVRKRIDEERAGSEDAKAVSRMLTRFGTPEQLVEREVRRLAGPEPAETGPAPTRAFPTVKDDAGPPRRRSSPTPPGVMHYRREARRRLEERSGRGSSAFTRLRQAAMAGGNPMATDGKDAWSIIANNRREAVALGLFVFAALLVPFRLPTVAIFPVPGLIWAVGAVVVLASEGWVFNDRLLGLSAPVAAYLFGGGGLALVRAGSDVGRFLTEFHGVSGVMFIIGTAAGVTWLIYRLLDPPPPPPTRSLRVTR
ncbi:hypothetical protein Aph01nite_75110 [Acrocarpospora phusangensis]|uniref:Uncharacterized protein n=1 Tax=Acrocarpospora phusangensis TaxID=1070424 RepID=A0A919QI14_9ACTN|nr:hypothetical protein [Acrocarpospora phusangensis]GIH29201.1 hypothetical protein Aph01nite_75110 [Acrocarpospora phusangensis]